MAENKTSEGFWSHFAVIAFSRNPFLFRSTACSPRLGSAAQQCESLCSLLFLFPVAGGWEHSVILCVCVFACIPQKMKSSLLAGNAWKDVHSFVSILIVIYWFYTLTKQMSPSSAVTHKGVCMYIYSVTDICKWLFLSFSIIAVCILFWLYWHDQHARYSPKHIDLSTTPSSLSVLVLRYASVWFVCCPTPFAQLWDSGVIVLQQLFQGILGLTVSSMLKLWL